MNLVPPVSRNPADATPHVAALDGIRALAASAVVVSHFEEYSQLGIFGVHTFFVLSGFLITGILVRARDAIRHASGSTGGVLRAFYARRALRIAPAYYATLLVAALAGGAYARDLDGMLGWHVAYLSNVRIAAAGRWPGVFSHLWSLSVEEQFYLIWPTLMLWLPRRWLQPTVWATIIAAPLWRAVTLAAGVDEIPRYVLPPGAFDSLGVGALLALTGTARDERHAPSDAGVVSVGILTPRWLRWGLVLAVPTLVATAVRGAHATVRPHGIGVLLDAVSLTAFACVCAALVWAARNAWWPTRVLAWRPLAYLGRISYGVYLFHLFVPPPVLSLAKHLGVTLPTRGPWRLLLFSTITLALATVSWRFIEQPINALKGRFPYAPTGRGASPAAASA